jgi:hypothetical protein
LITSCNHGVTCTPFCYCRHEATSPPWARSRQCSGWPPPTATPSVPRCTPVTNPSKPTTILSTSLSLSETRRGGQSASSLILGVAVLDSIMMMFPFDLLVSVGFSYFVQYEYSFARFNLLSFSLSYLGLNISFSCGCSRLPLNR